MTQQGRGDGYQIHTILDSHPANRRAQPKGARRVRDQRECSLRALRTLRGIGVLKARFMIYLLLRGGESLSLLEGFEEVEEFGLWVLVLCLFPSTAQSPESSLSSTSRSFCVSETEGMYQSQ